MFFLIQLIHFIASFLVILVIIYAFISFIMSPTQPFRRTVDSIVDPMLAPIRKIVPSLGSIDISPLIFVILIQFIERILISVLNLL